ncbi:hypothetical protein BpHYR1_009992 [Brachionus plicatilis]|uniref:Uncharacterized protein n=1 Tax=Brachionus plicatilis TaxID=10195 RepID=A0A3M7RG81_BRAPC|nr:hypothetical protein BpHYR1_009992 [Brachionus plicatilis]
MYGKTRCLLLTYLKHKNTIKGLGREQETTKTKFIRDCGQIFAENSCKLNTKNLLKQKKVSTSNKSLIIF